MVLALVAGIVMVTAGLLISEAGIPGTWKIAGMFDGIYTGGSPNLASIALSLNVDTDRFVMLNTYDMIVGAFLVLFFVSAGTSRSSGYSFLNLRKERQELLST